MCHLAQRVAQFRSENQGLKTKVKRLEEDCLRKSRQLDKLSLLAKEKTAAVQEKKREDVSFVEINFLNMGSLFVFTPKR